MTAASNGRDEADLSAILHERLFLSGRSVASNAALLQRHRIAHVLSVTKVITNFMLFHLLELLERLPYDDLFDCFVSRPLFFSPLESFLFRGLLMIPFLN